MLPLVAGLFILVQGLQATGLIERLAGLLRAALSHSIQDATWWSGVLVALSSNLINNLPTGLIAGSTAEVANIPLQVRGALLIGVDLGPNLSVTGSLATILWLVAIRREGGDVGALTFLNQAVSRQQLDQQAATVNQLDFLVKADAALVEAASAQLDYTKITAPIAGRTGFRQVDEGNIVNATSLTGIVTITQVSPIGVVFTAPGQQFADIRQALESGAAEVVALTTDGDRELARGQLTLMDNRIDTTSGSIKLKAIFKNEKGELWPGLPVATRLQVALRENVVIVPDSALQRGRDGLFAFVVDETNKVTRRDVEAPLVADGKALVVKGIAVGETVVTTGQYRLSPNMLVSVQEHKALGVLASDGPP